MRLRVLMMMEVFVEVEDGEAELGHDEQDLVRPHLLELEEQLSELGINMGGIETIEKAEHD